MSDAPLLEVRNLHVEFRTGREVIRAVNGANFNVNRGEVVAVLGESGSGKSVTAATIMRLLAIPPARITGGSILFEGRDCLKMSSREWRDILGSELALVLQDALTALNPVFPVGWQIAEVFRVHGEKDRNAAWERAVDLLTRVGIPDPHARGKEYPHQFSGGMRQRVMIAIAVALHPSLLIADEPTTALDVTVQAQIMELMTSISKEEGMSILLITHDLGVAVDYADRVCVMYAGRVVEGGHVEEVLRRPAHPYTLALMHAAPQAQSKEQKLRPIVGSPPDMAHPPPGCPFHPRCSFATDICRREYPAAKEVAPGRFAECHHAELVYDNAAVLA